MSHIYIASCPLSSDKDEILILAKYDEELIYNLLKYQEENLTPNNIEVFERIGNILIAEDGFYFALYEEDLEPFDETNKN